jgi:hypothetical protein
MKLKILLFLLSSQLLSCFFLKKCMSRLNVAHAKASKITTPSPYPFLHLTEYPNDDYQHIRGYGQQNVTQSKLQEISSNCIANIIRNKRGIDTVSYYNLCQSMALFSFIVYSKDVGLIDLFTSLQMT